MAYRIHKMDDLLEVQVWGETSTPEVLAILRQLHVLAPRKEISDLWVLSDECMIPWDEFSTVVKGVSNLVARDTLACRSAIVVVNQFQRAQLELFLHEARSLPYEIGVFSAREKAMDWLQLKRR